MKQGLVHLYYGMGKGKTTAAAGLCLRMRGRGGRVLVCQFLKTEDTGEARTLRNLGVTVLAGQRLPGFLDLMSQEDRAVCAAHNRDCFAQGAQALAGGDYDLVVLDEVVDAIQPVGILTMEEVAAALRGRAPHTEVVLTGHSAPQALLDLSDYVTEMIPQKHPYHQGVAAREGIEY